MARLPWPEDVEAVFARLAARRGCVWLDSAGGPDAGLCGPAGLPGREAGGMLSRRCESMDPRRRRFTLSQKRESVPPGASHAHPSSRWSVLSAEPAAVLVHQAGTTRLLAPDGAVRMAVEADPFGAVRRTLARVPTGGDAPPTGCPFGPGLYGYLAYDLGRYVEPTAGAARVRDIPLPDLYLGLYETVLVLDGHRQEAYLVGRPGGPAAEALKGALAEAPSRERAFAGSSEGEGAGEPAEPAAGTLHCNFSRDGYLRAVQRARDYIAAGDIFQVNLSRRFTAHLEEEDRPDGPKSLAVKPNGRAGPVPGHLTAARLARLYRRLRRTNPAPYAAYLGLGQGRAVLSSSPELFLDLRGGRVVTRPIKGTRPRRGVASGSGARPAPAAHPADGGEARGGSPYPPRSGAAGRSRAAGREPRRAECAEPRRAECAEPRRATDADAFNRRQRADLLASEKDKAELVMIIDLERNDLGRVCAYGTVRVTEPRRVEAYAAVFHTVATVEGRLHAGRDVVDLVRATFPGGSITGAPKVRAMQIISGLEPTRRSVYTGCIGYLGPPTETEPAGRCALNLAIRTLLAAGPNVHLQAGGGIVADSDPEAEFDETTDKARALLAALGLPA